MTDGGDKDDYEALLEMARAKAAAGRARLAAAAADLLSGAGGVLTDRERVLMSGVLRGLLDDAERLVRHELSAGLAALETVPDDLLAALADETTALARPILEGSELLCDPDLVETIRHRILQHRLSTALRRAGGAPALVGGEEEDRVAAWLEDGDAGISQAARDYLVEQAKRVDGYRNPVLRRPDLEPKLAESLYWRVSAALRIHLADRFEADPAALDEALDAAVRGIAAGAAAAGVNGDRAAELARRLHAAGRITPEAMVGVLRQGEVPLFEAMLAAVSGVRRRLLGRLLFEPGGEALAVVCKGLEIPRDGFAALFTLTRKAEAGQPAVPAPALNRILELYDRIAIKTARAVLSHWRRNPQFLDALRSLSTENPDGPHPAKPKTRKPRSNASGPRPH